MMRFSILCAGLLLAGSPAFAQQAASAPATPVVEYEYVTLVSLRGGNAFLDYGQSKVLKQAPTTELEKDYVAVQKIARAMLALSYLNSRGWEYVSMGNRQESSGSTSAGSFSIYTGTEYLLRRRKQ